MPIPNDETYMRECFRLAEKGKGFVSPNPLVGSVLVIDGRIAARCYHKRYGGRHAEVECLRNFEGDLFRATLYVNLEPCSHFGKTPPCVDLLIQRGIKNVIIGMKDPNPQVSGKGIRLLRRAGIRTTYGVLEEEASSLNRVFVKHITSKRPYVHVKIAQTTDGFIARGSGPMRYISSKQSRALVHRWRTEYDAVLIGAGTLRADNPRLNVRLAKGREPVVVLLDGRLSITGNEKLFAAVRNRRIIVCCSEASVVSQPRKVTSLGKKGVSVMAFKTGIGAALNLKEVLHKLYIDQSVGSILVEGGSYVFTDFIRSKLFDELSVFISPQLYNNGVTVFTDKGKTTELLRELVLGKNFTASKCGTDILLTGRI